MLATSAHSACTDVARMGYTGAIGHHAEGSNMGILDRLRARSGRAGSAQTTRSPVELQLIGRLQDVIASQPDCTPRFRLHMRFTGRVQGVGFRWTNRGLAQERKLVGWVMNRSDGSVDMELQGSPQQIVMHLDRLHAYYLGFNDDIWLDDVREIPVIPNERSFEVRHGTDLGL